MSHLSPNRKFAALVSALLIVPCFALFAQTKPQKKERDEEIIELSCFCVDSLGATPGGAKDINFFRSSVRDGRIPHPDSLTPEGLFSGYDLPLELGGGGDGLFRVQTAATAATFEVLPDARYLAQIALGSTLKAATWQRAPLNLIAVVAKSGSMDGQPLALVRASLHSALDHLREGDQLGIVLYGDRSHVHLAPTPVTTATRAAIGAQIDAIASAGSTNMEAGLSLGFDEARRSAATFSGTTRVMLFTDERPNVGSTDAGSFMALAEAAAAEHIGLTTIGVGEIFDTALATRLSSVSGGNLYFFPTGPEMEKTFAEDFDTMVSELARDFSIRIEPARGMRIEGVFGIPGDLLRWDGNALVVNVATVFLSKRKGAIYFALAPERMGLFVPAREVQPGAALARVSFSYRDAATERVSQGSFPCALLTRAEEQPGLTRGRALVDEFLTMKKAAQLHLIENDQTAAFRLASSLADRLERNSDAALDPEKRLARDVANTLALLSGRTGEIRLGVDAHVAPPLVGVWRSTDKKKRGTADDFLVVWPHGVVEVSTRAAAQMFDGRCSFALHADVPAGSQGDLLISEENENAGGRVKFTIRGDRLTLERAAEGERGFQTRAFRRCDYDDLPSSESDAGSTKEPALDSLSGLPERGDER